MHDDYQAILKRRVQQFHQVLLPMPARATHLVQGCCYAIFSEQNDDEDQKDRLQVRNSAPTSVAVPSNGASDQSFDSTFHADWPSFLTGASWRQGEPEKAGELMSQSGEPPVRRFVQFVFLERHFEMDLPRATLFPTEAHVLQRDRRGFFYLGDRYPLHDTENVIDTFHPMRKAYVYGDEREAAEDIAFLFFNLWRFPVDAKLYCSTFGGSFSWASNQPLEDPES